MIRKTRQREAIERALDEAARPLTPAELHELGQVHCPRLGLRTVYRNIREMIEEGRLVGIDYPGQPLRYERVNPNGHHPHFICHRCRKVFELEGIRPHVTVKGDPGPFRISGEEVVFFGTCPTCAESPEP